MKQGAPGAPVVRGASPPDGGWPGPEQLQGNHPIVVKPPALAEESREAGVPEVRRAATRVSGNGRDQERDVARGVVAGAVARIMPACGATAAPCTGWVRT